MKNLVVSHQSDQITSHSGTEYVLVPDTEGVHEKNLKDYLKIIKRRKWIAIIPSIIIIPIIIIGLLKQGLVYEATVTVLIEVINPKILSIEQVLTPEFTPEFYKTQHAIIKSRAMAEDVVDTYQLYEKISQPIVPRWDVFNLGSSTQEKVALVPPTPYDNVVAQRRLEAISQLQHGLQVSPRQGTHLVDITLRGRDRNEVARQVNMVAETYVRRNLDQKQEATKRAIIWLKKEARYLKKKIETSGVETRIPSTLTKKNILSSNSLQEKHKLLLQKIENLQDKYIETNEERKISESQIKILKNIYKSEENIVDNANYSILNDPLINLIREKYIQIKSQIPIMSIKYKEKHHKIINLNHELQLVKNSLKSSIEKRIKDNLIQHITLISKESSIVNDIENQKEELDNLKKNMLDYDDQQHEIQIDKELYHSVATRIAENQLTQALETNNIKILERASIPSNPALANMLTRLILGVLTSLGLGVGLAFFREYVDKKFVSTEEAERHLGIPFLGFIPYFGHHKKNQLITLYDPLSSISEAYRTVRTWIQSSNQQPGATLLITSAVSNEGKSTTAANLAVSFAQLGHRVLIIDADLRRPSLGRMFDLTGHPGLTDILAHGRAWKDAVYPTELDNLQVLPTGGVPHNPTELLSSNAMSALLEQLQSTFDTIIVDAPITLSIPDVTILAPSMQGVLLVHHPNRCEKDAVIEAKHILEKAGGHLIGVVFNHVSPKEQRYYYSAERYHQDYQYGSHASSSGYANQHETSFVDMRPTGARGTWVAVSRHEPGRSSQGETSACSNGC